MTDNPTPRAPADILAAVNEVERQAPGGAEALYMAAMLADSPLPYDFALAMEGAPHNPALVNPAAAFFAATALFEPLVERGLIHGDPDARTFTLPPDVRAALRDSLSPEETLEWAGRAVYGLNLILPDAEPQNWPTVQWLMPHVMACRALAADLGLVSAAANRVLHQAGFSHHHQRLHREAAELLEAAMAVDVALKGRRHPDIAADLEGLGTVYWAAGDLERSEAAFASCHELQREIFTEDNPAGASALNSLAVVRQALGRFDEAKRAFGECLRLLEAGHGPDHPATASCLSNTALLLEAMDRPEEALAPAGRALAINTAAYGEDHPETASDHNTVALLLERTGDAVGAEEHFRKSLRIRERIYGQDHPETAQGLCNLALLLSATGRESEALDLFDAGLAAYETALGPNHPLMEPALDNFIALLERLAAADDALRGRAESRLRAIVEKAGRA
ncbi:MAG: tetratricopeptide repeat protein [Desulfovibrionaceae bacterium]|nr:tetratricopeptide repeat protein [Desulfovibrionaceae bacterium]